MVFSVEVGSQYATHFISDVSECASPFFFENINNTQAVLAGDDWLCMPEADRVPFPFTITEDDTEEFCDMVA